MRTVALLFGLLVACGGSKETSTTGPIGAPMNLRSKLKPEQAAKAPADDKATKHELAVDVHGVKAKLVWRTFEDGPHKLVLSYQWEVVTAVPNITLAPLGHLNPENSGSEAAVNERIIVRVAWQDSGSAVSAKGGTMSFSIDGAGSGKPI